MCSRLSPSCFHLTSLVFVVTFTCPASCLMSYKCCSGEAEQHVSPCSLGASTLILLCRNGTLPCQTNHISYINMLCCINQCKHQCSLMKDWCLKCAAMAKVTPRYHCFSRSFNFFTRGNLPTALSPRHRPVPARKKEIYSSTVVVWRRK